MAISPYCRGLGPAAPVTVQPLSINFLIFPATQAASRAVLSGLSSSSPPPASTRVSSGTGTEPG